MWQDTNAVGGHHPEAGDSIFVSNFITLSHHYTKS